MSKGKLQKSSRIVLFVLSQKHPASKESTCLPWESAIAIAWGENPRCLLRGWSQQRPNNKSGMKTLSYSLRVEGESSLTPESRDRLVSYYRERSQTMSPAAAAKTYKRVFGAVPPTVELNIKKGKVFIVVCSDWACTVIGRSLMECIATFSSFHEEISGQLGRPIVFRFLQDESLEDLIKKDRRQRMVKLLEAAGVGALISTALQRLDLLLKLLKKLSELRGLS